jgi:hypothetical protein
MLSSRWGHSFGVSKRITEKKPSCQFTSAPPLITIDYRLQTVRCLGLGDGPCVKPRL